MRLLPILAAAITGILVGATMVATRGVIGQLTPVTFALLRYLIGCCCLLPLLLVAPRVRFARRDLLPIGVLGIVQFGVVIALLNYALQSIPSARAALIFALSPLLTMLLAAALGAERITLAKGLGVFLTVVGVGLALGEKVFDRRSGEGGWIGELAVLGSAACSALCSVLYRPYLKRYPALPVGTYAMVASVAVLALFAAREGLFSALPSLSASGWLIVGFVGVSSGAGYYLWLWALNQISATSVSLFLALSPITATALGALLLAEPISLGFLGGLGCVVVGIWVAQRPGKLIQA